MGQTRPASAPVVQAAAPPLDFAAHKRPQPASNDLDVLQSDLAKFDLRFESADITQLGGRNDKATDGITKMAESGLDTIHFSIFLAT
jgi:hypothetical protein